MSDPIQQPPWAPTEDGEFIGLLLQTGFSPAAYRDHYADLKPLNWDIGQALAHFLLNGLQERRVAPMTLNPQALVTLAQTPMHDAGFKARLLGSLAGHLFDGVAHPYGSAIQARWPVIQALADNGACPYFVAGDSHTNQYHLTGARHDRWLLPIHMLCTGASAVGLGNPASRSGYGALLRQAVQVIQTLPDAETVPFLLQFGQVDIEFVHHFQRIRDRRLTLSLDDYRAFCTRASAEYISFVTSLFPPPRNMRIFLLSVFPPALSDAAWHQGYVNADIVLRETNEPVEAMSAAVRGLQVASLEQRTGIHLFFNDQLKKACERHGFGFVDGLTPFLASNGVVDPRYVVPEAQGAEHHLDDRVTHEEVTRLIWRCIDQAGTKGAMAF